MPGARVMGSSRPVFNVVGRAVAVAVQGSGYTATHYVAPFASVSGSSNDYDDLGATAWTNAASAGTPTTLGTAMARATAGNRARISPGLYEGTDATTRWNPAFCPSNSGSAGNLIVFFAQYPAALNMGSPSLLSEIRRDIVPLSTNGSALNTWTEGDAARDYVIFDGLYADEAITLSGSNCGVFGISGTSVGCEFRRCWIERTDVPAYSGGYNGNSFYITSTTGAKIRDCLITGGGTSTLAHQNDSAIELYNSADPIVEYNTLTNCGQAIFVKTEAPTDDGQLINVHVRYNKIDSLTGIQTQTSRSTFIYGNEIVCQTRGIRWASTAEAISCQVQAYSNTIVIAGTGADGGISFQGNQTIDTGSVWKDNLVYASGAGTTQFLVQLGQFSQTWGDVDQFDYNFYYDASSPKWYDNPDTYTSLGAWQTWMATYGHEANSQHAAVTFEGSGDYRLVSNGQAALTASSTGGPVGCYVTGAESLGVRTGWNY